MKILIDSSKLGTGLAMKFLDAIGDISREESGRIKEDVDHYSKGQAKDDMLGWAAECDRITVDVRKARKSVSDRIGAPSIPKNNK